MSSVPSWDDVEREFDALLDTPVPGRAAALERLREHSPQLAAEVESLLRHSEASDRLLDQPALGVIAEGMPEGDSLPSGERVGAYRILWLAGRGGSGEVYAAERADGLYAQQVALKILRRDAAGTAARFELERQILAGLNDPGIARILDGGTTSDARPYLVMEWIDGMPITQWCAAHGSDLATRLRLFDDACKATAHAHRHLLVHRDLKPANLLVTAEGMVKLVDFGAAKQLTLGAGEATLAAPLTPCYAAPEQLAGQPVTTATDVYALGLLLYELLTGTRPLSFDPTSLAGSVRAVLETDVPPPSARARSLPSPPVPASLLEGDLDAIIGVTLRKEPEARYASVDALREDLARMRTHRPVSARSGRLAYVTGRLLRRHAVLAVAGATLLIALAAGFTTTAWQANRARAEARKATAVKEFVLDIFRHNTVDNPDGAAARRTTAEELLGRAADSIGTKLTNSPDVRAEMIDTLTDLYDQLEDFDRVDALERLRLTDLERAGLHGPTLERAQALAELGRALAMRERYGEAEQTLDDALRDLDALHDEHSTARVQALTTLGLVEYHVQPPTSPAAARHTAAALALLERYDPGSSDRLSALQLLARAQERAGDANGAERQYRAFLALARSTPFSKEPVALGCALGDLGGFLFIHQRYSEAARLLDESVQVLEHAEGAAQPDTLMARRDRDHLHALQSDYVTARSLVLGFQTLAATGEWSDVDLNNDLVEFNYRRGNWSEAQELSGRQMARVDTAASTSTEAKARATALAARLLVDAGKDAAAVQALERSKHWLADASDAASGSVAMNLITEARLVARTGDLHSARALYERAVAHTAPTGAVLPIAYVEAVVDLADLDRREGKTGAAVARSQSLVQQVLALPDASYRSDLEAAARESWGAALLLSGQRAQAREQLTLAVALLERRDDPSHPDLALSRVFLADLEAPAQARLLRRLAAPVLTRAPAYAARRRPA